MSCRSTPANSAITTVARLDSNLTDVQTLSAFHVLRAEQPRTSKSPTPTQWQQWLGRQRRLITAHPDLTKARRRSLLHRLHQATTQAPPDGQTWAALQRLGAHTQVQSRELNARITALAEHLQITPEEARARFQRYATEVDTARDAPAPEGYTDLTLRAFRDARLPIDRQTVHALSRLHDESVLAAVTRDPQRSDQRRITRHAIDSSAISEAGYDAEGGRLELVFAARPTRVYSYRNVPPALWNQISAGSAGQVYYAHIRGKDAYRYPDALSAEADGFRRQCPRCGQFTGLSAHTCPTPQPPAPRPAVATARAPEPTPAARTSAPTSVSDLPRRTTIDATSGISLTLPAIRALHDFLTENPVALPLQHAGDPREDHAGTDNYTLTGALVLHRGPDGDIELSLDHARCSCLPFRRDGSCPHLEAHHQALLRRLNPTQAHIRDVAAAQAAVEEALAQDWTRSKRYALEARERYAATAEEYYTDNPAAFDADVATGLNAAAQPDHPDTGVLPYQHTDATDGMLTRDGGRGFGVEIEFDFPEDWSPTRIRRARSAIARELYDSGLLDQPTIQPYGASADRGVRTEHARGWTFEEDSSVLGGEIISPIMYDEPATWNNLPLVCQVIRRHGGITSTRTGSHVHIGTASYDSDLANHTELVRLTNQHEDVLYRLAQDPGSRIGEHRPIAYCQPNVEVPLAGYTTWDALQMDHDDHYRALNTEAITGGGGDNAEFRHWDASLDASVIQAQVKVSAALVVAAQRVAADVGTRSRPRETLGSHYARNSRLLMGSRRKLTPSEREADTATTRALLDTLFTRRADKAQIAALFGVTRWQRQRPSRGGNAVRNG